MCVPLGGRAGAAGAHISVFELAAAVAAAEAYARSGDMADYETIRIDNESSVACVGHAKGGKIRGGRASDAAMASPLRALARTLIKYKRHVLAQHIPSPGYGDSEKHDVTHPNARQDYNWMPDLLSRLGEDGADQTLDPQHASEFTAVRAAHARSPYTQGAGPLRRSEHADWIRARTVELVRNAIRAKGDDVQQRGQLQQDAEAAQRHGHGQHGGRRRRGRR